MNFSTINWLATVVAALSAFMFGGLWYSKLLFANAWMAENNFDPENPPKGNMGKIFGFTAFFSLVMAVNLAMFLNDPKTDLQWGTIAGFLAGIWAFCAIAIAALFELKSWRYIFINGLYILLSLTIMGAIIGGWR